MGKRGASGEAEKIEIERDGSTFDLSKLLDPKFGKIDPSNMPHIGGNTWAGGVGGYSTAGLGGVGGPFRLTSKYEKKKIVFCSDWMQAIRCTKCRKV